MIRIIVILLITAIGLAFKTSEPLFTYPKNWPKPIYNFKSNTLTKEKVELGKILFYDTRLSKNNTISCASCHSQYSAFTHIDHALSHGIYDSIGNRNSPALMNLAWQPLFMWDGAINNIEVQSLAPISHPKEMASSINEVIIKLNKSKLYKQLFYKAYRDSFATSERTLKSLAQFMLTLVSSNSKYDRVVKQQDKFTEQEKNGYELFKKYCNSCHTEPLFSNYQFANNGLPVDKTLSDVGRFSITKNENDSFKFKIPTLRNVEFTYPYMHDGRFKKLSEVLNHYTKGIFPFSNLSKELKEPINLTSNEKVDLIAFLLTLSDKEFVFNKKYSVPINYFQSN